MPERLPIFRQRYATKEFNVSKYLYADILQEVGLKAHMANVFDSYRKAAALNGVTGGIDQTRTFDLFLAPFDSKQLINPWVGVPIGVSLLAVSIDYLVTIHGGITPLASLTRTSNMLYGFTYTTVYPIGSAAPEEMFYRGFLQNEFQTLYPSPYFSIPASTLAYAYSHKAGMDRLSATVSGLYLGFLSYKYDGNLAPGITFHFWSDIFAGVEALMLTLKAQTLARPISMSLQIGF